MTLILSLLLNTPWNQATPEEYLDGLATFYDCGVMERVAVNRGHILHPESYERWLQEGHYVGAVALNPAGDLGRRVWIEYAGVVEGPFLVLDCAQAGHYDERIDQGRVVEVDGATAQRWGMRGPVPVRVWFQDPAWPVYAIGKVPIPR